MSQSVFETTRTEFLGHLSDEDKILLQSCTSLEAFQQYLKAEDEKHHESSYSRKLVDFCQPVVTGLLRLSEAINVFSNASPDVMALLWGGIRVILHVAESFREFFDAIMSSIEMLGVNLSRVELYEGMFSNSPGVQNCLQDLYKQVLQFFLDTKRLFRNATEGKQQRFLPRRLRIAFKAMLSSFRADIAMTQMKMSQTLDRLDKEAQAASYMDNKEAQGKLDVEFIAARQHRDAVTAEFIFQSRKWEEQCHERQEQTFERREQNNWRTLERSFWEEQIKANQIMTSVIADEMRRSLFTWLSPTDPEDHHIAALRLQYPGTCTWILDTPEFEKWTREGDQLLWVHGIPGAGKTILAASIIKHLHESTCPDEAVIYYYFDHRNTDRQTVRCFLATIVTSLASQSSAYLEAISTRLNNARAAGRSPNINILQECIAECPRHFEAIFIVVDALDESSDTDELMSQLICLVGEGKENVKLLATSRSNKNIEDFFEEERPGRLAIELEQQLTHSDIVKYVKGEVDEMIRRHRLKIRDSALKQEIISVLSEKAEGMFQWVKCQLDQIRKLKADKAIRKCLQKLPKDLTETYIQALKLLIQHHDDDEVLQIQRLFRWLVHAARPLDVEEMAEVIAVDFDQQTFDLSAVVTEPLELLNYGESLITLRGEKRRYLQLSHFSVKEFLLSDCCLKEVPEFFMDVTRSNAQIAQICLTALKFEEFALDPKEETVPEICPHLYNYAISHWTSHYNIAQTSESCPKTLAALLLVQQPESPNFASMRKFLNKSAEYLPIHYCAQYGLLDILHSILESGIDIDIQSEPYGSPLNFAARYDQALVSEFLLDRGADVNSAKIYRNMRAANNCLHWSMDEDRVSFVSVRLVKYIAETPGLDVNSLGGSKSLQRPLHYAAWADRPDLLEVLLSCGAAIDGMDGDRRTPLQVAVEERALDSVGFLLDQGASMIRADKCDSMRESGFGLSNLLPTSISEARWEVAALLRSHRPTGSRSTHWGFTLGEAAQRGQLEVVKGLLDENVNIHSSPQGDFGQNRFNSRAQSVDVIGLEAKVGTMFAALDLALHGRHLQVVMTLVERMILLFEHQQEEPTTSSRLDIHAVMIHDRPDTPFIECLWSDSALYISIILGHLRLSLSALEGRGYEASTTLLPANLVEESLPYEMQLIIYSGWHSGNHRQGRNATQSENTRGHFRTGSDASALEHVSAIEEKVSRMCENARILWKAKRNPKEAINIFFSDYMTGEDSHSETNKAAILEFLSRLGVDINSLDRAGRTPLYWAHVRLWPEMQLRLELLGGQLFASPDYSLNEIKISILSLLEELNSSPEGFASTALDLSRKWDWDNLARYLYFGGDATSACRAFEAGAVFDPTTPGDVPAFHYFICDACHTEYRDDHLLRGKRFVPLGLVNIDLCPSCAEVFGPSKLAIPSQEWIRDRRAAHEEQSKAFARIDEEYKDDTFRDRAKAEWKHNAAIELRSEVLEWIRDLKNTWNADDQSTLLKRYKEKQEELVAWLAIAEEAHKSITDLERW